VPELTFAIEIEGPVEAVFAAITDFDGYHRWLPGSDSFGHIRDVSPTPLQLGSTYIDEGPSGTRRGEITEFAPPTNVSFHQPMSVTKPLRGTIDIDVRCRLEAAYGATRVIRTLTIRPRGLLVLAQPLILATFRRENKRVLAALKRYIEGV
jgi:uncharacterized protein YndB with AHSA1/START domain